MSETHETPTTPTTVATNPPAPTTEAVKPYWLYRFAAWVVIVAGILFIVTTVFFAGFKIAGHHGHHGCHHHWAQHHAVGPGGMHHGHGQGAGLRGGPGGPGGPNDHVVGPSQPPQSVAPSLAPAHP
jgi:hypothetical protein